MIKNYCDKCGKECVNGDYLEEVKIFNHDYGNPYVCNECKETLIQIVELFIGP